MTRYHVARERFTREKFPAWICPTCDTGLLEPVDGSFHHLPTSATLEAHGHPAHEPEWDSYTFSTLLRCGRQQCKEVVALVGEASYVDERGFDWDNGVEYGDYELYFQAGFFSPPLNLITVPVECPLGVRGQLEQSFALYIKYPGAAANYIRASIEELLTELGVRRFQTNRNRKKVRITLHDRIALLDDKRRHIVEKLTAVKWIGNAGSHGGQQVAHADVDLAYELYESVLRDIYDRRDEQLLKKARAVNRKKGV